MPRRPQKRFERREIAENILRFLKDEHADPWGDWEIFILQDDAGHVVVPSFTKGIPSSWQSVDENDPPIFESEASYLDRHGLLTATEKKFLEKHQG
jgi:hypothetical protein